MEHCEVQELSSRLSVSFQIKSIDDPTDLGACIGAFFPNWGTIKLCYIVIPSQRIAAEGHLVIICPREFKFLLTDRFL